MTSFNNAEVERDSEIEDEEGDEESSYEQDDDDTSSSNDEEQTMSRRHHILFLCQEGQLQIARHRFHLLQSRQENDLLQKEIFQVGRDKNYPLHEILMGGTSDTNARLLAQEILDTAKEWKLSCWQMLMAQPPSHRRTTLHWAAWGNANFSTFKALVQGNPEALIVRDRRTQGSRTPLEIYRRYYTANEGEATIEKLTFLETSAQSWIQHRLRLSIHASAFHYFRSGTFQPFLEKDRKLVKMKPRPWFVLSILGYLLQRELQPLVVHILTFVGSNAKVHNDSNKKKRKRKSNK
jgi:hypothetical protein